MRNSLYWDYFDERAKETISCLKEGKTVPVRRVSVFITKRCNLRCFYCNLQQSNQEMTEREFHEIVQVYSNTAIIHITGGEPSVVKWLYPYIRKYGDKCQFHLNTNAIIRPPADHVRRLKISLDSCDPSYWNFTVGRAGAFDKVVENIKYSIPKTVVSITFTMTRQNYLEAAEFARFAQREFLGLYAVFFSVYKGSNPHFAFRKEDADRFFSEIKPELDRDLDPESKYLLNETIDEKRRIMQGVRFPENTQYGQKCYLSLSERVFSPDGSAGTCSHLHRDGVKCSPGEMSEKCNYGCNRRLVEFNRIVDEGLKLPI